MTRQLSDDEQRQDEVREILQVIARRHLEAQAPYTTANSKGHFEEDVLRNALRSLELVRRGTGDVPLRRGL